MSEALRRLVTLLALEKIEEDRFRGQSQDLGWGTVFGGQVLGQALSAAVRTVPAERHVHSIHAYFLRSGDVDEPIVYEVDRIRDGSSFTTRRVVAVQGGKPIFNLAASFHKLEGGFEHQDRIPTAPVPESCPTDQERFARFADKLPEFARERATALMPFELRMAEVEDDPFHPTPRPPERKVWLRAVAPLPDDPALHACVLAYASDFSLVTTSLLPHGVTWLTPGMQVASLDHVMWFHRPLRVDKWLLHVMDSPSAHGARGLARGRIFTRDGRHVATTSQEGLVRRRVS